MPLCLSVSRRRVVNVHLLLDLDLLHLALELLVDLLLLLLQDVLARNVKLLLGLDGDLGGLLVGLLHDELDHLRELLAHVGIRKRHDEWSR